METKKRVGTFLRIRDFELDQTYKCRFPEWIKLRRLWVADQRFRALTDTSKYWFWGLMLVASHLKNQIPNEPDWLAQQLGSKTAVDVSELVDAGLVELIDGLPSDSHDGPTAPDRDSESRRRVPRQEEKREGRRKKREKRETYTHTEVNVTEASVVGVCGSRFTLQECLRYAEDCKRKGDHVTTPPGLAMKLHRTGEGDELIARFLNPQHQPTRALETPPPDPNCGICNGSGKHNGQTCVCRVCSTCNGTGMEIVNDKGSLPCRTCRKRTELAQR